MQVVLSIAGSDCSGGAGIQADLKTFEAFGVFGTSVLSALTAQNTQGVKDIFSIEPRFIQAQLKSIFEDFQIDAIKIGMLFSNEIIDIVREFIKDLQIPIVLDPVFISKAGSKLLHPDAVENMKSLFPYCTLITPNLFEAKELFGYEDASSLENENLPCAVIVKNHIKKEQNQLYSVDILFEQGKKYFFQTPFVDSKNTHGTGCSFSSAIAANLALGQSLHVAIETSKRFIYFAIKNAPNLGHGKGPIAHKKASEFIEEKKGVL
jgi:hydroxymethylpyrimidine/phosphomethylpyrimidine kinase